MARAQHLVGLLRVRPDVPAAPGQAGQHRHLVDEVRAEHPQHPVLGMLVDTPACSISASNGRTPEWLATTRAAPDPGTCSRPRIRTRNHEWYSGRNSGMNTLALNSGSKPDSSTGASPVIRCQT